MREQAITTTLDVWTVLRGVKFNPSCVNLAWDWSVEEVWIWDPTKNGEATLTGWFLQTSFQRPDTDTGKVSRGYGRQEFIPLQNCTTSRVVKTAWLCAKLIVEHELMEAFTYDDVRIFNPHHTVDDLSLPTRLKTGDL